MLKVRDIQASVCTGPSRRTIQSAKYRPRATGGAVPVTLVYVKTSQKLELVVYFERVALDLELSANNEWRSDPI